MEAFSSYGIHADVYIFNSPPTHPQGIQCSPAETKFCDTQKLYKDESFQSQVSGQVQVEPMQTALSCWQSCPSGWPDVPSVTTFIHLKILSQWMARCPQCDNFYPLEDLVPVDGQMSLVWHLSAKTFALSTNCNHMAHFYISPQLLEFVQPDHLLTWKSITGAFHLHQLQEKFPDSSSYWYRKGPMSLNLT